MSVSVTSPPAPSQAYNPATRVLHWAGAVVVIIAWVLGISLDLFPRGPDRMLAMGVHTLLGLVVMGLAIPAILLRMATAGPAEEGPRWLVPFAKLMHATLYVLVVLAVVTGLLARWAHSGDASLVFGWTIPAPFPLAPTKLWGQLHEMLSYALAALVVAHVVAVAVHHLVLHDGILCRMIPSLARPPAQPPRVNEKW